MARDSREFKGPDGTRWTVEVRMPTASNAMIVFHNPAGSLSGRDRYAWYQWHGPEARSVTSRVSPDSVMKVLTDDTLALLFRRSMLITAGETPLAGAPNTGY
ncbi:MAG TPA: hypothetical protein VF042_00385 [Gemmatimonadaceae bacterium]